MRPPTCPFRKFHPVGIRAVRLNHRIIRLDAFEGAKLSHGETTSARLALFRFCALLALSLLIARLFGQSLLFYPCRLCTNSRPRGQLFATRLLAFRGPARLLPLFALASALPS